MPDRPSAPWPISAPWHDVVIVGGGLVGGLCALLLAGDGVPVTLIDQSTSIPPLEQRDARVFALSLASIDLLKHAGLWPHLTRMAPYTCMHVWQRDGAGELCFDTRHPDWQAEALGVMVEPRVLSHALALELPTTVDYQTGVRVIGMDWIDGGTTATRGWLLRLSTGAQVLARLVIGADGGLSPTRHLAGIPSRTLDYQQHALTCAILTEQPHAQTARQVFLKGGPLALLPLADLPHQPSDQNGRWHSVVWSMPSDQADELSKLDDDALGQLMAHASGYAVGRVQSIQSRSVFPLKANQAERYAAPALALIGDAAHVIHPMAGQGVNLGLLDAAVLAHGLLHDRKRGLWAHAQTLARYERERYSPTSLMMHGLSALGWIQNTEVNPLEWLRGEGFRIVSRSKPLRHLINQNASGRPALKGTRYARGV